MSIYKIETIEVCKSLYSERKDIIDYLERFGNRFEKAQAILIKEVAEASNVQNARTCLVNSCGHFSSLSSSLQGDE